MDIKKILKQYKDFIILVGLGIGALTIVDAKISPMGLLELHEYAPYGFLIVIGLALYVYYENNMVVKPIKKKQRTQQIQSPIQDVGSPEEMG